MRNYPRYKLLLMYTIRCNVVLWFNVQLLYIMFSLVENIIRVIPGKVQHKVNYIGTNRSEYGMICMAQRKRTRHRQLLSR
jgi:hypothetical protein